MQTLTNRKQPRNCPATRRGVAATEFALVLPVLMIIILGAIDVGEFINVGQVVAHAAREGAREASRDRTTDVSQVEHAVRTYLSGAFPNMTAANLGTIAQVTVSTNSGGVLTGSAVNTVPSGDPITVTVSLSFDAVRWLQGVNFLGGRVLSSTTVMRRQ
jgi:Flp pilus assembly protein TadG